MRMPPKGREKRFESPKMLIMLETRFERIWKYVKTPWLQLHRLLVGGGVDGGEEDGIQRGRRELQAGAVPKDEPAKHRLVEGASARPWEGTERPKALAMAEAWRERMCERARTLWRSVSPAAGGR